MGANPDHICDEHEFSFPEGTEDYCIACGMRKIDFEKIAVLEKELIEAIPFVEMAGAADNSGEEYGPLCQECTSIMTDHKSDCILNAWLERNKEEK